MFSSYRLAGQRLEPPLGDSAQLFPDKNKPKWGNDIIYALK